MDSHLISSKCFMFHCVPLPLEQGQFWNFIQLEVIHLGVPYFHFFLLIGNIIFKTGEISNGKYEAEVDGWTYTMSGTEKYELAPDILQKWAHPALPSWLTTLSSHHHHDYPMVGWGWDKVGLFEGGWSSCHYSNELSTSVALISMGLSPYFLVRGTLNLFYTTTNTSKHGLSTSSEHLKCCCIFRFCRFEVNL